MLQGMKNQLDVSILTDHVSTLAAVAHHSGGRIGFWFVESAASRLIQHEVSKSGGERDPMTTRWNLRPTIHTNADTPRP